MLEIEKSFGNNICRCTGYRPILEAFKKFAKDAPSPIELPDIEDLQICKKTGKLCKSKCLDEDNDWCMVTKQDIEGAKIIELILKDGKQWYKIQNIEDIFTILKLRGDDSYMLVSGNTAKCESDYRLNYFMGSITVNGSHI